MNKKVTFDKTSTARFVTFSCYHNYNLFKTDTVKNIFLHQLDTLRTKYMFKIYGYVIMPNHVHLVLLLPDEIAVSKIIGELKSLTGREIISHWQSIGLEIFDKLKVIKDGKQKYAFWQRKYYDHNCRTKETTIEKINYCHKNPVTKSLVEKQEDWIWSSFRSHHKMNNVMLKIDEIE